MDDVSIRTAVAPDDDVRVLISELDETLSREYPPEQRHGLTLDAIFRPNVVFFVASLSGAAAGCGGVAFFEDYAEVKRMYVREAARGRGVARALLARIETETLARGYEVLRLETGDRLLAAMQLYESAGFRSCASFGQYAAMTPSEIGRSRFFEKRLHA